MVVGFKSQTLLNCLIVNNLNSVLNVTHQLPLDSLLVQIDPKSTKLLKLNKKITFKIQD